MDKDVKFCKRCHSQVTRMWWKCCRKHTSQNGRDVICEECVMTNLHPQYMEKNEPAITSK